MSDQHFGWLNRPKEVERFLSTLATPLFADAGAHLKDTGKGKTVLLYEAARKVMGQDLDPGPQKIGDCVSWGWGGAVDLLACVEVLAGERETYSWDLRTCTEAVYALSRVEFGNLDGSYEDGSVGAWAAAAAAKGGYLSRQKLGPYDPKRAKAWGAKGLPDEYEAEAKTHVVETVSLVKSYEEARDLIANGYPVPVCSDQGFSMTRDAKGFCRPQGTWNHCMKFVAASDDSARPGLLCDQSWGPDTPDGPKGDFDIPDNSFWVEAQTVTRMLRQGDSYAIAGFKGYEARSIDWVI
jgi:hypothetical protein